MADPRFNPEFHRDPLTIYLSPQVASAARWFETLEPSYYRKARRLTCDEWLVLRAGVDAYFRLGEQ